MIEWIGMWRDAGFPLNTLAFLIDAAWKGAALLAMALLVALAIRRRSAAERHAVWSVALAAMIVLPFAMAFAPRVEWIKLPPKPAATAPLATPAAPVTSNPTQPTSAGPSSDPVPASVPANHATGSPEQPAPQADEIEWPSSLPQPNDPAYVILPTAAQMRGAAYAALGVWAIVALLLLAREALAIAAAARAVRRAPALEEGALTAMARDIAAHARITRRVRLLRGDPGAMPIAAGLLRAALVFPAEATDWPAAKMRAVLAHELAHVARRDCLTQALGRIAVALHWFNPLAWFALRRARDEQERACDDAALKAGAAPTEYAGVLVDVARARMSQGPLGAAAIGMARPGRLEGRVAAILDARRNRRGVARFAGIVAIVVAAAIVITIASLKAIRAEDFSPAYEKAQKIEGLRGKVAEQTFLVWMVARNDRERRTIVEDGKGAPLKTIGDLPNLSTGAEWLDQANIYIYPQGPSLHVSGIHGTPEFEAIEVRVFDHATRQRIEPENGRTGFGLATLEKGLVQLRSAGALLPEKVDLWFRMAIHEDSSGISTIDPVVGASADVAGGQLVLEETRDGRSGYNTVGGTVNWAPGPSDSEGSSFVFSAKGAWTNEKYQIRVLSRTGRSEFPSLPHYFEKRAIADKLVVQFATPLADIESIEVRPFGERHTFWFDGIQLPKVTGKPFAPIPPLTLSIADLKQAPQNLSLGPIAIRARLDDGVAYSGISSSASGIVNFERKTPVEDPGLASSFQFLIDGMQFATPHVEMLDAQGESISPGGRQHGYGSYNAGLETGSGVGFQSHVPISEIAQVQLRFAADSAPAANAPKIETVVATTPNPFAVRAVSRNTKEGAPTWADGHGQPLAQPWAQDDLGTQGSWLDVANIHWGIQELLGTRRADYREPAVETMQVWAYESGTGKPLDLGGGRIGYGIEATSPIGGSHTHYQKYRGTWTIIPDESVQLRSAGKSLPESVNLWVKAAIHDDPNSIATIYAKAGTEGAVGTRTVRIASIASDLEEGAMLFFAREMLPGRIVTLEWVGDGDVAPMRVSYMGRRGRIYAVDPEVRSGDARWQGRMLQLRFECDIEDSGVLEFWPAVEPKHYAFTNVKFPGKTLTLESPRELEFVGKGNTSPEETFRKGPDAGFDLRPLRVSLQGVLVGKAKVSSWIGQKTGVILPFQYEETEPVALRTVSFASFTIEGMKFAHPYVHLRPAPGKTIEPGKEGAPQSERSDRGTGIVLSSGAPMEDVAMYVLSFDWEPGDPLPKPWLR